MADDDVSVSSRLGPSTPALIIDAASSEFAERGYEATSLRAVARRGQVDPRLVQYYFSNKQELLRQVLHRALMQLTSRPEQAAAFVGPQLVAGARDSWRRHARLWRLVMACGLDGTRLPEAVLPALLHDVLGAGTRTGAALPDPRLRLVAPVLSGRRARVAQTDWASGSTDDAGVDGRQSVLDAVLAAQVVGMWLLTEGLPAAARFTVRPTLEARWAHAMSLPRGAAAPPEPA